MQCKQQFCPLITTTMALVFGDMSYSSLPYIANCSATVTNIPKDNSTTPGALGGFISNSQEIIKAQHTW